jgi:hypothetical protein
MTLGLQIFIFNIVAVTTAFSLVILISYRVLESTVIINTCEKLNLIRTNKTFAIEDYFHDLSSISDLISSDVATISIFKKNSLAQELTASSSQKLREYSSHLLLRFRSNLVCLKNSLRFWSSTTPRTIAT